MNSLQEYSGTLTVMRCWCGVQHAVPASLAAIQQRQFADGQSPRVIYCPLGHTYFPAGESKKSRLERQLVREQASHDQTRAALQSAKHATRAEKAAKTRLKKRIAHGVCPCCHRTFVNMKRHMESQHPDFAN